MVDMNIPAGFGFIAGRGQERARQVLAATEQAGFDQETVLTRGEGFLAPVDAVKIVADADDAAAREAAKTEETEETEEVSEVVSDDPNGTPVTLEGEGVEGDGQPAGDETAATEEEKPAEEQASADEKPPVPDGETDEQKAAREAADAKPAGNASTEAWSDWAAKYKGYDVSEQLSRSEIIERFGA